MSREQLNQLLQDCLAGFDAGLSPEECLSAYPHARDELEPLLRQALALRIAFATSPRAEFRRDARERLLFAAGRDVKAALTTQPDEDFVADARMRFLVSAGAPAQEALRAVPPPRLPFWSNARRRLLEAASLPKPQPAFGHMAFALRSGLTAAVVVIAVAVAGITFMAGNDITGNGPRSASADLEYIEQQLDQLDQMRAQGQPISSSALEELTRLTSQLVAQLETQPSAPLMNKLPELIERQQQYVETENNRELVQAQQDLQQAEEKIRQAAARATETATPEQPVTALTEPSPSATAPQATATSSSTPSVASATPGTPSAGAATPQPTPQDPATLADGEVLVRAEPDDDTLDLQWLSVRTNKFSFLVANDWNLRGYTQQPSGKTMLDTKYLIINTQGANNITILVNMENGEVTALLKDESVQLRGEGVDGDVIEPLELVEKTDNLGPSLYHFLNSIEFPEEDEEDEEN